MIVRDATAKPGRIIPISDTNAAIGAGAIMIFFVLWALIAGVGDDFVYWIGGKDNLSGWAQAVGAIAAIFFAVYISRKDRQHSEVLQAAAELSAKRKEREIAGALINRFAGVLSGVLNNYRDGIAGYLWDIQKMRVALAAEIDLIKILPLNALTSEERILIFSVQNIAYQLYEALLHAEKSAKKNSEDRYIIDDISHLLLDEVVESHFDIVYEKIARFEVIWEISNERQFPSQ